MRRARFLFAVVFAFAAISPVAAQTAAEPLKKEPKGGDVRYGRIVYVDDGTCPPGEIKEITGGSNEKQIERKVRCVKRPAPAK